MNLTTSLRRLAPEVRAQLQTLAVFHEGVSLDVWMHMMGADAETVRNLTGAVIGVGLGTYMNHGHLRLAIEFRHPGHLHGEFGLLPRPHARTQEA